MDWRRASPRCRNINPSENHLMGRAGVVLGVRYHRYRLTHHRYGIASRIRLPDRSDGYLETPGGGNTLPDIQDAGRTRRQARINVLIEKGGDGQIFFSVLEVDSADPGQFDQADADFLAGFAGLLGVVGRRTPRFRTH